MCAGMSTASDKLRVRVREYMDAHKMSQTQLAARLGKTQSWLSRRLTGDQSFRMKDLDPLATIFRITVPELFFDTFGQWDRRTKVDRRKVERRQRRQILYDARLEITSETRMTFPRSEEEPEEAEPTKWEPKEQ